VREEQDYRLEAELEGDSHGGLLDGLLELVRGRDGRAAHEVSDVLGADVLVTHDGRRLFAYARSDALLRDARQKIEQALARDGIAASVRVSHWDDEIDEWVQLDPPLGGEEARAEHAAAQDAERIETRTIACTSGKLVRESIERAMLARAQELGLECRVVEHPHLLTTQVLFTLTGAHGRIEEFRRGLQAEAWATIRADGFGTGLI
jgi:hypothetical protein